MTIIFTKDLQRILSAFRASMRVFHRDYANNTDYASGHKAGYTQALSDIELALCEVVNVESSGSALTLPRVS